MLLNLKQSIRSLLAQPDFADYCNIFFFLQQPPTHPPFLQFFARVCLLTLETAGYSQIDALPKSLE